MRNKILIGVLMAVIVGAIVAVLVLTHHAPPPADIMAGSSLIGNIVEDVADGKLETRTLIPPGTCPGHYDVKTSDIEALANSTALFIHDYQQYYQNVAGAVEAANNPDLIITVLNVTGNWMVPSVQAEAVGKIAQALEQLDPENAVYYQQRAADREQAILAYGEEVEGRLQDAGVDGVKVICAEMQAGFVSWAGFDVVATFGRPEDLSPAARTQLIDDANQAGAVLIIDNLQSGSETLGTSMEQDTDAVAVTISNFPGGLEDTETWEKAIDENVNLLLAALNEWEEQYG
jgi:zinc transport system substrate-binding protein